SRRRQILESDLNRLIEDSASAWCELDLSIAAHARGLTLVGAFLVVLLGEGQFQQAFAGRSEDLLVVGGCVEPDVEELRQLGGLLPDAAEHRVGGQLVHGVEASAGRANGADR